MRFWDSSALVPLLVEEPRSDTLRSEFRRDPDVVAWWSTELECLSALARLERDEAFAADTLGAAQHRLDELAASWREVEPTATVKRLAARILRVHPLHAADALQLGAAVVASESEPKTLELVTLDDRLARAAEREGFRVIRPDGA